jgi:magnesium transporter
MAQISTKINKKQFESFFWIDISHPDLNNLNKLAEEYQLDYFQIKDSLEQGHLPKFESYGDYNFMILRAFTANVNDRITNISELSNKVAFFFNDKKLITVHRNEFEFLKKLDVSCTTSEELLITIIHKMIDTFEEPSSHLSNQVDDFEKNIFLKNDAKISLEDLYFQKSQTRISKKLLQITQGVINEMEVSPASKSALQDIKDRLLSLILTYDEVADDSVNLMNTYLSVSAQKSNDVMKLLTIFSAFFLPLTFIAGIYGMNFENMPELTWQAGYFLTLGVMTVVALVIFVWFKRKRII